MNNTDRSVGMGRNISRRDFMNGVAMTAGALVVPKWALAFEQEYAPERSAEYYPPTLTGMRGDHVGSFEVAHELRDRRRIEITGPQSSCGPDTSGATHTGETYDLVVVGGGLSGLGAAHYFLKNVGRSAKVLILDNHDDFGGHAKRNEFHYKGKQLALNGGTLNIESPLRYDKWSRQLPQDIGVDLDRYAKANASNLADRSMRFEKRRVGVGARRGVGIRDGDDRAARVSIYHEAACYGAAGKGSRNRSVMLSTCHPDRI